MESDKNLNMKTEIPNPALQATFDLLGEYYKDIGLPLASKYIKFYSRTLKEQMVSKKREGRKEFKEIATSWLHGFMANVRSFGDRLTGRGKE